LTAEFGRRVSLSSFRGRVVILAFNDSECTTICPLTTTAMTDAKAMLGPAAKNVQLLGVNANPTATAVKDVWSYSDVHGMLHAWSFLTGSLAQLERVWHAYAVESQISHGQIDHTPALCAIGPTGQKAKVYITQQSYASVGQLGQILAREASSLLPDHPRVHSDLTYKPVALTSPAARVKLPRAGGGSLSLGPDPAAHLYLFFATWDRQVTGLAGGLTGLNRYATAAATSSLPPLTAVDEGSVEPNPAALGDFLDGLRQPLTFPVAVDQTGTVADGYEVLDLPWFVLISSTGHILFYWDVSTAGWPSTAKLEAQVRAALARAPRTATSAAALAQELAGSPAPLAALHQQANRLIGGASSLMARVRALRGYPVVLNAWAEWCGPCKTEFPLLASAAAAYGRKVAFLGADVNDSAANAASFLAQHPVSYPSYEVAGSDLDPLAALEGTPSTIFINRAGKVTWVHTGQYFSQGTLDQDIATYALGGD